MLIDVSCKLRPPKVRLPVHSCAQKGTQVGATPAFVRECPRRLTLDFVKSMPMMRLELSKPVLRRAVCSWSREENLWMRGACEVDLAISAAAAARPYWSGMCFRRLGGCRGGTAGVLEEQPMVLGRAPLVDCSCSQRAVAWQSHWQHLGVLVVRRKGAADRR